MSEYAKSGLVQRLVALTAAGAIAAGGAVFMVPTAFADDYDLTDDEVIAQIESEPWPHYTVDDEEPNIDIRGAQRFLEHLDYPSGSPSSYFEEELEEAVLEFQDDYDLVRNGELDYGTWLMLRQVHFPKAEDAYRLNDTGQAVRGIQELVNHKFGEDLGFELEVNGIYDQETHDAVWAVQEALEIGADGEFGQLTMRAVITYADYTADVAALEAEEGVEGTVDEGAEEAAEEAAEEGAEADGAEEAQEGGEAAETDEVEATDEQDSAGEAEATEQSQE